jgi:hypothetical protein
MSRTGTAEGLPVYTGVPEAPLPQPETLTTVTWNEPALGPLPFLTVARGGMELRVS